MFGPPKSDCIDRHVKSIERRCRNLEYDLYEHRKRGGRADRVLDLIVQLERLKCFTTVGRAIQIVDTDDRIQAKQSGRGSKPTAVLELAVQELEYQQRTENGLDTESD